MKGDRERCLAAGMDDYIAKPIRAKSLIEVVESAPLWASEAIACTNSKKQPVAVDSREEIAEESQEPASESSGTFDPRSALGCVNGDADLLKEIVNLFLDDCPRMMNDLREAIVAQDAAGVKRLAHTLKNSLGYFHVQDAYDKAYQLETMGGEAQLSGALEAFERFAADIARLQPQLSAFEIPGET